MFVRVPDLRDIARAATRALLDELETTPKPGLVDRNDTGAHRDLSFDRLTTSALALEAVFAELAEIARDAMPSRALREEIGEVGRRGERAMLRECGGANTHRGALWALGILVAARTSARERSAQAVAARAAQIAVLPDRFSPATYSHGRVAARRYGARGARDEASSGFPHVMRIALPALRAGVSPPDVLLRLMATIDDTCVLHRGGLAALAAARDGAVAALRAGGVRDPRGRLALERLDRALLARNASPGGCADLLAAGFFLHAVAE